MVVEFRENSFAWGYFEIGLWLGCNPSNGAVSEISARLKFGKLFSAILEEDGSKKPVPTRVPGRQIGLWFGGCSSDREKAISGSVRCTVAAPNRNFAAVFVSDV